MRFGLKKLCGMLGALALLAFVSTAGHAAPLVGGSLTIVLGTLPSASFLVGPAGTTTSNLNAVVAGGNVIPGTVTRTVTGVTGISSLIFNMSGNAAGAFTGAAPGTVNGAAAFTGGVTIIVLGSPAIVVPLSIGTTGTITTVVTGLPGGLGTTLSITAIGNTWTAGTTGVTGVPFSTTAYIPFAGTVTLTGLTTVTVMGANLLSAGGNGTLVLVTATKVLTSLGASPILPLFSILTLSYVPEPGTLLLLGSGVAGLALLGRRRRS